MVARVMKKSRVNKLLQEDTSTVFDFFSTKCNLRESTEKEAAIEAACGGHVDILKYFVEERKISDEVKLDCRGSRCKYGRLDCLKYLVEEAKVPLNDWRYIAYARYYEHPECVNYLLEKGSPEPTDEEYAQTIAFWDIHKKQNPSSQHHNDA